MCYLDNCMEETNTKDDLPPLVSQNMVLKEAVGDFCESSSHICTQSFGRLISHLADTYMMQSGPKMIIRKDIVSCSSI